MIVWRSFGASVAGPSHVAVGQPNQDAWAAFHHVWGDGIAVSDGLGSRPYSNYGSQASCRAVACTARALVAEAQRGTTSLFERIKSSWLSKIAPLKPRDCAATCLFAFRIGDGLVRMGMLGDGLVAAMKVDGSVVSMSDAKTDGFSNITDALSANVAEKDWRWLSIPEHDCISIILCTDGVADDLTDTEGFVKGFTAAHLDLSSVSAARRTCEMLENWPTPNQSDDKTIACLFREDVSNE